MKRVEYKFKHIQWKYFIQLAKAVKIWQKIVKQNIAEQFKSKQQKSLISSNILIT